MASFQNSYSTLLRASLAGCLKKRDKAKERRVDKMLKEKRKRMEEQTSKVKVTAVGRSEWQKRGGEGDLERLLTPLSTQAVVLGAASGRRRKKRQTRCGKREGWRTGQQRPPQHRQSRPRSEHRPACSSGHLFCNVP